MQLKDEKDENFDEDLPDDFSWRDHIGSRMRADIRSVFPVLLQPSYIREVSILRRTASEPRYAFQSDDMNY